MYIFFADDLLLVEIDVEEDFLVGDIGEIEWFGVESHEDSFLLGAEQFGLSFVEEALVIGNKVIGLFPELVALDIADEDELGVLGLVDEVPLLGQELLVVWILHIDIINGH